MVKASSPARTKPSHAEMPAMDYREHLRTFSSFTHFLKWSAIHVAVLLLGLYFLVIPGDPVTGMTVIVLAIGAFIWGMLRVPAIEKNAETALKPHRDSDEEPTLSERGESTHVR
jgi:hypothetical protein